MLRWKQAGEFGLVAFDKWTLTHYRITELNSGEFELVIIVQNCDDSINKTFATVRAAKTWVTKNFG